VRVRAAGTGTTIGARFPAPTYYQPYL